MASATFLTSSGTPAATAIRAELHALTVVTVGDLLHVGQIFRSRIRQRTFAGVDVHGAAFAPLSTRSPFYLYPNREGAGGNKLAMATAAKGRHAKTGRIGIRTSTGIKYESYAAAQAAHGRNGSQLYGMEQHPHMLDAIMVRCGGQELSASAEELGGGDMSAFEANYQASQLEVGFYGPEAERAKGNNEGTGKGGVKREFFALNQVDLQIAEKAIAQRMVIRARSGHQGPTSPAPGVAEFSTDDGSRDDWISF